MAGSGGTQKLGNRGAAVGSQDHVLEKLAGKLPGEAEQAEGIQVIRTGTKAEKRRLLGNGTPTESGRLRLGTEGDLPFRQKEGKGAYGEVISEKDAHRPAGAFF